jgi:hypothetical protein
MSFDEQNNAIRNERQAADFARQNEGTRGQRDPTENIREGLASVLES